MLAWIVLRKSRAEEAEERAAAPDQPPPDVLRHHRETLLHLARQDGIEIPPENIIAELKSGEHLSQRPDFTRLLKVWQSLPEGTGGVVYVMEVDRLSRGILTERGVVQDALARAGIRIRTPSGLTDLSNLDQTLLFEVRGSLARHELQRFKQRVRATLDNLVRSGQVRSGAAGYGYRWDKNLAQLVPHDEEFPKLQAMCRDALTLSSLQLEKRYGISYRRILGILRNPAICGWPAERWKKVRSKTGVPVMRLSGREKWLWPERQGDYPPACTREEWEAVQAAIDGRRLGRDRYGVENCYCRDVVEFVQAPGAVTLGAWGDLKRHYDTYERSGWGGVRLYIARDTVHAAAEDAILTLSRDRTALLNALEAYRDARAVETPQRAPGDALGARIAVERRKLDELLRRELLEDDPERRASLDRVRREVAAEVKRLSEEQERRKRERPFIPALDLALPVLLERDLGAAWADADERTKRLIANALLERVEVVCVKVEGERRWVREVLSVVVQAPFGNVGGAGGP